LSSGSGHSDGSAAAGGSAKAAQRSTIRGSFFSPRRMSLRSTKRISPTKPVRSGIRAINGAKADFQVRGMISALP